MSDGDALLRAILMNPADDVARLVYADWLQDGAASAPCACGGVKQVECYGTAAASPGPYRILCEACGGSGIVICERESRANYIRRGVLEGLEYDSATLKGHAHRWFDNRNTDFVVIDCHDADDEPASCLVMGQSQPGRKWLAHAFLSRGFISEIHLPIAAFMEHAKALFSAHPIERVTLTDRLTSNDEYPEEGNSLWRAWFRDGTPAQSMWPNFRYYLPAPIFDRLSRGSLELNALGTQGLRRYPVYQHPAYPDLSLACVAYGRYLAGLPAALPGVPLSRAM